MKNIYKIANVGRPFEERYVNSIYIKVLYGTKRRRRRLFTKDGSNARISYFRGAIRN